MFTVGHASQASGSLLALQAIRGGLDKVSRHLTTGLRIASAKDSSAMYNVATQMRSEVALHRSLRETLQTSRVAVITALDAAEKVTDLLISLKATVLHGQSAGSDLAAIQRDVVSVREQIQSIVSAAAFDGVNLLNDPEAAARGGTFDIAIGLGASGSARVDLLKVGRYDMTLAALGNLDGIDLAQRVPLTGARPPPVVTRNNHTYSTDYLDPILYKGVLPGLTSFSGAVTTTLSSDDRFAYVAGQTSGTITVFERDDDSGNLVAVQTVQDGVGGVNSLAGVRDTLISPDGRFLYATSRTDQSLNVFERDTFTGRLSFVQAVTDGFLQSSYYADMSDDGDHIYVASVSGLNVFQRNPTNGRISFVENVSTGKSYLDVTLSEDGRFAYGTSYDFWSIDTFSRDEATGRLTLIGSQALAGEGCMTIASSDNRFLYTTGYSGTLQVFERDQSTGSLTLLQTLQDNVGGVGDIWGAVGLTLDPQETKLYLAAAEDNAVTTFVRDTATGLLSVSTSVRDGVGGVNGLSGVYGVTVSHDGSNVYTSSYVGGSVSIFERPAVKTWIPPRAGILPGSVLQAPNYGTGFSRSDLLLHDNVVAGDRFALSVDSGAGAVDISLIAVNGPPVRPGEFTIGGTAAQTLENLSVALVGMIRDEAPHMSFAGPSDADFCEGGIFVASVSGSSLSVEDRADGSGFRLLGWTSTSRAAELRDVEFNRSAVSSVEDVLARIERSIVHVSSVAAGLGGAVRRIDDQADFLNHLTVQITNRVGDLVDADLSEESARYTALKTREQLALTTFGISNNWAGAVLSLFQVRR